MTELGSMSSNSEGIISFLLQLDCDDSVKKNYIFYPYKVHILSWTDVKDSEDQKRMEKESRISNNQA